MTLGRPRAGPARTGAGHRDLRRHHGEPGAVVGLPPVTTKASARPNPSQATSILLVRPPRDRPSAGRPVGGPRRGAGGARIWGGPEVSQPPGRRAEGSVASGKRW